MASSSGTELKLFAYRFQATDFEPYGDHTETHAFVAQRPVRPLGPPEPVSGIRLADARSRHDAS